MMMMVMMVMKNCQLKRPSASSCNWPGIYGGREMVGGANQMEE